MNKVAARLFGLHTMLLICPNITQDGKMEAGIMPPHLPPSPLSLSHGERQGQGSVAVVFLRLHLTTMARRSDHPSPAVRERGRG